MRISPTECRHSLASHLGPAAGPAAGHSIRLDLLKRLLAVPSYSRQEGQMVEFLVQHVRERGSARCGEIVTDEWHNVYIRKGNAGIVPCLAAHIDTVHPLRRVEIVEQDGVLVGFDEQGKRTGIGGDDKAGVFVCLELLEQFDDIAVALFAAEEIGCMGAKHAPASWFEDVGCLIEFDCPRRGLVSYTSSGTRLFANNGEFIQTATPALQTHGLTRLQHHPFSDVMALRQRFNFSCLNLSCGYHNWHRSDEYVVIEEVEAAINAGEALISALGGRAYPFAGETDEPAVPQFEVTGLQLT
jgi:tripeptide aminopeptidase